MKPGLQVVRFDWPSRPGKIRYSLAEIGKTADFAGFDGLWAMDYFFQMDAPRMGLRQEEPMFDGYIELFNYLTI